MARAERTSGVRDDTETPQHLQLLVLKEVNLSNYSCVSKCANALVLDLPESHPGIPPDKAAPGPP